MELTQKFDKFNHDELFDQYCNVNISNKNRSLTCLRGIKHFSGHLKITSKYVEFGNEWPGRVSEMPDFGSINSIGSR